MVAIQRMRRDMQTGMYLVARLLPTQPGGHGWCCKDALQECDRCL
jgi:hypothetical protein